MDPFETTTIGTTDVTVPKFGIGTAPLGGWPSAVSERQALSMLNRAWEQGIRYFDTAPFYGHGLSEEWLGKMLRDVDRSSFTLSTKVGRLLVPGEPDTSLFEGTPPLEPVFDFSVEGVHQSLADSRDRLGFHEIDIALIHDPDDHHEQARDETFPALAELRESGELGAIGVGMNWSEPLTAFARECDFDCFLVAGRYTLLEQGAMDNLLPEAERQDASVICGGVYNSGLLISPEPGTTYNYEPADDAVLKRAQALEAVCEEFDVPLRAAAIQFPLAHDAVAAIVVGARTAEEVDDNLAMLQLDIPDELWSTMKEKELIRESAPVPP